MTLITKSKLISQPDKNNVNQEIDKVWSDMRALACYVWLQSLEYLNARICILSHKATPCMFINELLDSRQKNTKIFPSFIRCMPRIELYWAVVKRKATNCFVRFWNRNKTRTPRVFPYANGLMTRSPMWSDSVNQENWKMVLPLLLVAGTEAVR